MSRFNVKKTLLADLCILERQPLGDKRGYLERMYCHTELMPYLEGKAIRQINHTRTAKQGVLRGLHFQHPPNAEKKIVACLRGKVLDVAVDLRKGSSTFLRHHAAVLSAENFNSLIIPEGFAHGFQTLEPDCEMLYMHTADYRQSVEGGLNALDPKLGINWPLPISERSERDTNHAILTPEFYGIETI